MLALIGWWRFFYFFRDPERLIPTGKNIVSRADGVIIYIKRIEEGIIPISTKNKKEIPLEEITKLNLNDIFKRGYIIGIFMSLWDVHINRAPISGTIRKIFYFSTTKNFSMVKLTINNLLKKKRLLPQDPLYLFRNERNTIFIEGEIPICVVQIADEYVNKIICWKREGDYVEKGERIGLIQMGSQVDLLVPHIDSLGIKVKEGMHVKAGESILAIY
ncbi:MAG: phosphatidylserine decarboxylase [Candidatus Omnitrophica bacterium]|nr:phosphatidylserine decarboxylase [Candidatus Omnitrophota bacterium]